MSPSRRYREAPRLYARAAATLLTLFFGVRRAKLHPERQARPKTGLVTARCLLNTRGWRPPMSRADGASAVGGPFVGTRAGH